MYVTVNFRLMKILVFKLGKKWGNFANLLYK